MQTDIMKVMEGTHRENDNYSERHEFRQKNRGIRNTYE